MATTEGWSIPDDLIIKEILKLLPVKSLVRFRSVCKAWNSEISNRRFIEVHRERSQPNIYKVSGSHRITSDGHVTSSVTSSIKVVRLSEEGDLQHYYTLPYLEDYGLLTSSRDLIVLSFKHGYLLSNPAQRDLFYLPHDPWDEAEIHLSGFGFVSSLGKYKVVSIIVGSEDTFEVFTVGMDNSWRKGKSPPFNVSQAAHMPYVNGNLHMLSLDYFWEEDYNGNGRVLAFNLEEEAWSVMPLPDVQKLEYMAFELRELQGLLCFVGCIPHKVIEVWMLRDYASNVWSKDFVIDGTHLGVNCNNELLYGFPLKVMTDGRIFLETVDGLWFYYDPQDGSIQLSNHEGLSSTVYAESLVPVSGF